MSVLTSVLDQLLLQAARRVVGLAAKSLYLSLRSKPLNEFARKTILCA